MTATGGIGSLFESRYVERPIAGDVWTVPGAVELRGERLVWRYTHGEKRVGRGRLRPGLLERFYRLADSSAAAIVDYARENGVLYLCGHDRPASHAPRDTVSPRSGYLAGCDLRQSAGWYWERVVDWRRYAARARATVNVAVAIERGNVGASEDWRDIYGEERVTPPLSLDDARLLISLSVTDWLREGLVQPSLQWIGDGRP